MKKLVIVLAVLAMSGVVFADDFLPPDWRGFPLSVEAEWDFTTPPANWGDMTPDHFNSVGGIGGEYLWTGFPTHAEVDFPSKWGWVEGGGITPGEGGDNLVFSMQNWVDDEEWKDVRVQFTGYWLEGYTEILPPALVLLWDVVGEDNGAPLDYWEMTGGDLFDHDPITGVFHSWMDLRIWPNPDWEKIVLFIPQGLVVDQVYIDTISIPEPATMLILALGGLLLRRRKA